jgi:hypothetical protein
LAFPNIPAKSQRIGIEENAGTGHPHRSQQIENRTAEKSAEPKGNK